MSPIRKFVPYLIISDMKKFNILDDIPYKYIKNYEDDIDIVVFIEDIVSNDNNKYKTSFKFELNNVFEKKFNIIIEYERNSAIFDFLNNYCLIDEE